MGGGSWTSRDYATYLRSSGRSVTTTNYETSSGGINTYTTIDSNLSYQDIYKSKGLSSELSPLNVMRECLDTEEHPNTIPVILALDVTGSMGKGAFEVARALNVVMSELYSSVKDVEFMIMAIGDLAYDYAPIQISQFESDVRIAQWVDQIYFEGGGGWNTYESYTAAWYMGLKHCQLDCWKRNKKGIIITLGDEPLNPYLSDTALAHVTGDYLQGSLIKTDKLYEEASQKFDIYHLAIDDSSTSYLAYADQIQQTFGKYLDCNHLRVVKINELTKNIIEIVQSSNGTIDDEKAQTAFGRNEKGEITW